eukprot:3542398-Prorocentrum_lima.AAC.1
MDILDPRLKGDHGHTPVLVLAGTLQASLGLDNVDTLDKGDYNRRRRNRQKVAKDVAMQELF